MSKNARHGPQPRLRGEGTEPSDRGMGAGAIAGELAGVVLGSGAGPAGAIAGLVLGGFAGALAGMVLEDEGRRAQAKDTALDEIIGVIGGDLGARRPPDPKRHEEPEGASEAEGPSGS